MVSAGSKSNEIFDATGINPDTRIRDITEAEVTKLRDYIDRNVQVEGDCKARSIPEHKASDRDWML